MRIYLRAAPAPCLFASEVSVEALSGGPIEFLPTLLLVADFHALNPVREVFASLLERWADEYQVLSSYLSSVRHQEPALGVGLQQVADLVALAMGFGPWFASPGQQAEQELDQAASSASIES